MDDRSGRRTGSLASLLPLVLLILATVGAALLVIWSISGGDDPPPEKIISTRPGKGVVERPAAELPPPVTSTDLEKAVVAAREESSLGDSNSEISVAVWGRDWDGPSDFQGDKVERLWSLSKPVIALAALGSGAGEVPSRTLVEESITRSSNCAARSLVVDLDGSNSASNPREGVDAFEGVLAEAGITLSRGPQVAVPVEDGCSANGYPTLRDADEELLPLFGTAEWRSLDAVRFMRALGDFIYGSPGQQVLRLMAEPKLANEDPGASCDPGRPEPDKWVWGIGKVFEGWKTYFKSAWGGGPAESGPVMFSQMGLVERGDESYALAVSLRVPDHLGGESESQCVTLEEIELVEEVLEPVESLLARSGNRGPR